MSRDIKFRAWHDGGEYPEEAQMLYVGDKQGTTHPLDCCIYYMGGQPVTLMQYTGLKDKNGVEIYEGDIVQNRAAWGGSIDAIVFQDGCFGVKDGPGVMTFQDVHPSDFEIIGNIHENKELLEEN